MNFQDLNEKLKRLDESLAPPSGPIQGDGVSSLPVGECGGDMHMPMPTQGKQQDSVNMSVTMNGQGAGGIRDLMNILRNIEDAVPGGNEPHHAPHGDDNIIIGSPAKAEIDHAIDEPEEEEVSDEYLNKPHTHTSDVDSVINSPSDDLNAEKGKEHPPFSPGNNTLADEEGEPEPAKPSIDKKRLAALAATTVSESLINKLSNHYTEVKNRNMNEAGDVKHGYGDPETWGGQYPPGQGPRRRPKDNDAEPPDDYRAPGTGSQKDIEGDILDKWQKGFEHHRKTVNSEYVDQEGEAPNGKRYNKLFVIDAPNYVGAYREEDIFKRHNWGAKDVVDEVKKKDEHGRHLVILYIVDNHKYGHWKPFKDSVPKKPISFSK